MTSSYYFYNPTTLGIDEEPIEGTVIDGEYNSILSTIFGNWKMVNGGSYYYRTFSGSWGTSDCWVASPWVHCYGSSYGLRNIYDFKWICIL